MRKLWMLVPVTLALLAAVLFVGRPQEPSSHKVRAVVSILPQAYFVERIGGELVDVEVLVRPGQSPHTYEPTPAEIGKTAHAQVYFAVDMPFEARLLERISAANKGMLVVDTRKGVPLRSMAADEAGHEEGESEGHEEHHGHAAGQPDPHFWLSPRLAGILAANVCDGLKAVDAAHAAEYQANLKAVQDDLAALDAEIAAALAPLKGRAFFVYHPAFGYFADAYGVKQVPVEIEGKSPNAKDLALLIARARDEGVKVIFVQPQFSPKGAQAVAAAIGGAVVPIDDLPRDYIHSLQDMAQKVGAALSGE